MPFESLKRTARDRKYALDAVDGVLAGLGVGESSAGESSSSGAGPPATAAEAAQRLGAAIEELQRLKRKVRLCSGRLCG